MIIHLAQPLFDTDSKKITFEFQKKTSRSYKLLCT